jgi:hypothetical protein
MARALASRNGEIIASGADSWEVAPAPAQARRTCYLDRMEDRTWKWQSDLVFAGGGAKKLVDEACAQLRRVFGLVDIAVEEFVDPEATERASRIFVVAKPTFITVDDAMDLLAKFDNDWWFERRATSDGRVQVTVEIG